MDTVCNDIEQNNNVPKENVDEYDDNNLNHDMDNSEKDLDNIIEENADMEYNTEQQDMEYNTEQQDDNNKADVAQNTQSEQHYDTEKNISDDTERRLITNEPVTVLRDGKI